MRRGFPIGTAVAATVLVPLLTAPAAHADLGEIIVAQVGAGGHVVCLTDTSVANVSAPKTITIAGCAGSSSLRVLNETNLPVVVHYLGTTQTVDKFATSTFTVQTFAPAPADIAVDVPKGW